MKHRLQACRDLFQPLKSYKADEILKSTPIVVILQNWGGVDPTPGAPAFTSN